MPEIPAEAVRAAAEVLEEWRDFTDKTFTGYARAALEAAAPLLADQVRREVADQFRAYAARLRAVPDKGLTLGQTWDRDSRAMEYVRLADVIERKTDA